MNVLVTGGIGSWVVKCLLEGHRAFLLTADDNRTHTPSAEIVEKHFAHLAWPKIAKETYLGRGEFISLVNCDAAKQVLGWQPKFSQFDPESGYGK